MTKSWAKGTIGTYSCAADLWSLGFVAFELAVGHRPFAQGDEDNNNFRLRVSRVIFINAVSTLISLSVLKASRVCSSCLYGSMYSAFAAVSKSVLI